MRFAFKAFALSTLDLRDNGQPYVYQGRPMTRNAGAVMQLARDVAAEDIAAGRVQVWPDKPPFAGGLYVWPNKKRPPG